jgi:hypothetical protein
MGESSGVPTATEAAPTAREVIAQGNALVSGLRIVEALKARKNGLIPTPSFRAFSAKKLLLI